MRRREEVEDSITVNNSTLLRFQASPSLQVGASIPEIPLPPSFGWMILRIPTKKCTGIDEEAWRGGGTYIHFQVSIFFFILLPSTFFEDL